MSREDTPQNEELPGADFLALGVPLDPALRGLEHEPATPDFGALYESLAQETVQADESIHDRMQQMPTPTRRGLALCITILVVLGAGLGALRDDLSDYPPLLLAGYLLSMGALIVLAVRGALRPIHQPAPAKWMDALSLGVILTATALMAVLPWFHDHADRVAGSVTAHAMPCFGWGFLVGLPIYVLLRLISRDASRGRLLSAAVAGLAGNVALELHCPVGGVGHLMLGHAAVLLAYVGGVWVIDGLIGWNVAKPA